MTPLDAAQRTLLHELLERQLAELEQQEGAEPGANWRELAVDEIETSPADKATVRLLNDLAHEAAGHTAAQLRSVRQALARFEDDSYGLCEECGNPIGFSRLQARPDARLCISCQTRAEKRQG